MIREEDAPSGRDCSVSLSPPPAFAELVDSAALESDLMRQWPDPESSAALVGRAVFTIRVDSTADVTWIDIVSSNLADADVTLLSNLLRARAQARTTEGENGPRRAGWTFRISVAMGRAYTFEVGHPVFCVPQLRNEQQISAKLNALLNLHGLTISGLGQSTLLLILPGEDGRPQRMEVTRSSGNATLDQIAQHAAADARFDRATADGRPLEDIWVSIPVNFAPQQQRRRK